MKTRYGLIAIFFLLTALVTAVPIFAQPATPGPAVANPATTTVEPDASATSAGVELAAKEVTPEKLGKQLKKVVSDWHNVGWLAGLAALVALLIMVLKYKPIDKLFAAWGIKFVKPLIASVLGGVAAGIAAYLAEGDVVVAFIAGLVIIGPAAVGFFETLSKLRKRNRDGGGEDGEG